MGAELEGFFYYLLNFQWFNLLCRHVTVTDEVDNCCVIKLKQFNRQASWGALDRVESEKQWGEHTSMENTGGDFYGTTRLQQGEEDCSTVLSCG